jgi:cell division septation protein DedD
VPRPQAEPAPPAARPPPAPERAAPEKAVAETAPPARGAPAPGRPPPAPAAPAPAPAEPQLWTVQVSSFRSRALADELRGRLAGRGFDAYVVSISGEEGRVRHRVRVGSFPTRGEAERVAQDLRSERNLNPFVTARAR